jgi:hypothetical protein
MRLLKLLSTPAGKTAKPNILCLVLASMLSAYGQQVLAQCSPAPLTVSTTTLVVNTYYPGNTATLAAGAKTILLGASNGASTPIAKATCL